MPATFTKPCPKPYQSEHFKGKHNVVGIYQNGRRIGDRCVSCGARAPR